MALQITLNKVRVMVLSPTELDSKDQTQLDPFNYRVTDLNDVDKLVEIGKGKATFLSYWATWCPPCIAELPSMQELYNDYGDQINFVLLTNENLETVNVFMEKKEFELPVFIPRMQAPDQLFTRSIPTNYIIDGKGKILIKETGAADWNSEKVRQLLNKL